MQTKNQNLTVRIATFNNFNFSQNEITDYYKVKNQFPHTFVNSHIKTKIADKNIPVIITLNPNIIDMRPVRGYTENIKALRVKFVYSPSGIKALINCFKYAASINKPVLITFFRGKKGSKEKFNMNKPVYSYKGNYYRLTTAGRAAAIELIEKAAAKYLSAGLLNYCDKTEKGCNDCLNCSKLTYNTNNPIYELNLSSGGHCRYNCVDCFAKVIITKNNGKMACNILKQNKKQKSGVMATAYIKINGINKVTLIDNK